MAGENIERSRGQPRNYKFDRGGSPTEFGPFIGRVTNNIDPTRQGRLQVYIEQFAGPNPDDPSLWRTVSYLLNLLLKAMAFDSPYRLV